MTDPIQTLRAAIGSSIDWTDHDGVQDALTQVENLVRGAQRFIETTDRAPIPLAPFQAIPWDDFANALAPFEDTP